jgi:CRISPR-associated protein Cmr1
MGGRRRFKRRRKERRLAQQDRGRAMANRITATFEVVTPLFLGGADPTRTVELRPPSIKGALRFWWRALAWSRHNGDLIKIRAEESRLFGTAGDDGETDGAGGQASFFIRVRSEDKPSTFDPGQVLTDQKGQTVGPGARYCGYGLMEAFGSSQKGTKPGQLVRACIRSPWQFTVEIASRTHLDPMVLSALQLMGLLGGLGARTRRGYGSLSLLSLAGDIEPWQPPSNCEEYKIELRRIVAAEKLSDQQQPPFTAFAKATRLLIARSDRDPFRLLNEIGLKMMLYRSWGRNGKIGSGDSEKNFEDDHDWFKLKKDFEQAHPRRAIFGLPHNYSRNLGVISKLHDRRASPLFIHIQRLKNGYVAVLSIMQAQFLEETDKIWVWQGKPERPGNDPNKIPPRQLRMPTPDWNVLDKFLDRFGDGTGKNPDRPPMQVLP